MMDGIDGYDGWNEQEREAVEKNAYRERRRLGPFILQRAPP
jgi:hypothetical protein